MEHRQQEAQEGAKAAPELQQEQRKPGRERFDHTTCSHMPSTGLHRWTQSLSQLCEVTIIGGHCSLQLLIDV